MLNPTMRWLVRYRQVAAIAASCVAISIIGVGCSSSSSSPPNPAASGASSTESVHNDADIEFAQMMIPHHEQAVVMAEMVPSRTSNAKVIALAEAIKVAQTPEIVQLTGWLQAWNAPLSADSQADDGHGHSDHGGDGGANAGMMSAEQMQQLEQLSGAAFDTEWLEMMIEHHEGAVEMSKQELAAGENAQAKALAQQIITSQQVEINEMQKLLKG